MPAIALDLTTRHIPPPSATRAGTTGTRWYAATLYALVRNPFYIGLLAQRSRVERGAGKKRLKPEEYVLSDVKGNWEQPLSEEQFHTFSASIQTNRQRAAPRTGLLTGLVQCPQGRPMRLINQSLYGCDCKGQGQGHKGQSVDGGRLETWLQEAITAFVDTLPATAIASSGKAGKRSDAGKAKVDLAKVRQQKAEKESQAQDLILREGYFVGLLGRATYEDTARKVRGEIFQLQQKADELSVVASRPDLAQVGTFVERMKRFDPWPAMETGEKRAAFESVRAAPATGRAVGALHSLRADGLARMDRAVQPADPALSAASRQAAESVPVQAGTARAKSAGRGPGEGRRDIYRVVLTSVGTNNLIKEGATPVTETDDILRALNMVVVPARPEHQGAFDLPLDPAPMNSSAPASARSRIAISQNNSAANSNSESKATAEQQKLLICVSLTPRHIDAIAQEAGMTAIQAGVEMTLLELGGLVRRLPGNTYIRAV